MNKAQSVPINPKMLVWARQQLGLSLTEAVTRIKLKDSKHAGSAESRLLQWEKGESAPTVCQIKQIAKAYWRPFVLFFLSDPPKQTSLLSDFRTIGDHQISKQSPEFKALRLRIESLHETLKEIEETDPQPDLKFVGSISLETPREEVVNRLNSVLKWEPEHLERARQPHDLLPALRSRAENAGIYVVLLGDLGSYHSRLDPDEFRGIAISDKKVPLVVINPNDSKTAQVFTLIHEIVHILLGETGISNDADSRNSQIREPRGNIERFCNKVAAEFLVPKDAMIAKLQEIYENSYDDDVNDVIIPVSRHFKVSAFVIVRRMNELGLMDDSTYFQTWNRIQHRGQSHNRAHQTESTGGPSRNVLDRYRLGTKLLGTVIEAAREGIIPYSEASRLLNLRRGRFNKVLP